jgi:CSLREA domain-containing protein
MTMCRLIPLLLSLLLAAPALATSFTVNSQADVGDDNLGDNVCHAINGIPGICTLRAAVQEANAHAGSDTIFLTADQVYTLTRAGQDANANNGDLDITDDVSILFFASGTRPVVDVNGQERSTCVPISAPFRSKQRGVFRGSSRPSRDPIRSMRSRRIGY